MQEDQKPAGLEIGSPMYVESLMTSDERSYCKNKLHYTTYADNFKPKTFPSDEGFKWRYGMGDVVPIEERIKINKNIDYLKAQMQ